MEIEISMKRPNDVTLPPLQSSDSNTEQFLNDFYTNRSHDDSEESSKQLHLKRGKTGSSKNKGFSSKTYFPSDIRSDYKRAADNIRQRIGKNKSKNLCVEGRKVSSSRDTTKDFSGNEIVSSNSHLLRKTKPVKDSPQDHVGSGKALSNNQVINWQRRHSVEPSSRNVKQNVQNREKPWRMMRNSVRLSPLPERVRDGAGFGESRLQMAVPASFTFQEVLFALRTKSLLTEKSWLMPNFINGVKHYK